MATSSYNFGSRAALRAPCNLADLPGWFESELRALKEPAGRQILRILSRHLQDFVAYPERPLLLWRGCARTRPKGEIGKTFVYPAELKQLAKTLKSRLDTRKNGPAVLAFHVGAGVRPPRSGSKNAWSIHHLYSRKFPYCGKTETLHAVSNALHFTQSAGLVAIHPLADAASDEYPSFAWLLRAQAFLRFGYDPDAVFAPPTDALGFAHGKKQCPVIWHQPGM